MNSEERILTAFNLKVPDRVPLHTIAIDGNLVDQIIGGFPKTAFDLMNDLEIQYNEGWVEKFNLMLPDLEISIFQRMLEAAARLGFDACCAGYIPFKFRNKKEMTDVFGRIYKVVNNEGNILPFYYDGLIKDKETWKQFPKPDIKDICKKSKNLYKSVKRKVRDKILVMAADDYTSIFPPVWQGMGWTPFVRALYQNPKLIQERLDMTTELVIELFKTYSKAGAKIFFEGGDIAYKTGPLLHPKFIDKFILPCYQKLTEKVHDWGGKIIFHSDGNITPILDFIVKSGFDGLHCLEPTANVDLKFVKKKVGDKLCILGNIDTTYILSKGNKNEVKKSVIDAIKMAGYNGGFILSPSNSHHAIKVENLKWMINFTHEFGKYPLEF